MAMFLKNEISECNQAHQHFTIAQRRSDYTLARAKIRCRLFLATPTAILACFGLGALKGATSDNPPSKRRQALFSFARTAFFNFIG